MSWVEKMDPTSGRKYYFHEGTGESKWDPPVETNATHAHREGKSSGLKVVGDLTRRRSVVIGTYKSDAGAM